jgi:alkyl hydroperoxide reductase subunit AhpF
MKEQARKRLAEIANILYGVRGFANPMTIEGIASEPADAVLGDYDVLILGAGPAGLAAGIYARRAGLDVMILERGVPGGQVLTSPNIENYPGFPEIPGMKLMDLMADHAKRYVEIKEGEEVVRIRSAEKFELWTSSGGRYTSKALILDRLFTQEVGCPRGGALRRQRRELLCDL